jgi:hypothetical protein
MISADESARMGSNHFLGFVFFIFCIASGQLNLQANNLIWQIHYRQSPITVCRVASPE